MAHAQVPFFHLYRINALRALGALSFGILAVTAAPPVAPLAIEVLGTLAIFAAISGRAWSLFYIGGRKNAELVTDGPYSISRNPLYLFSLVGIAGIGAQIGSVLAIVVLVFAAYLAFDMAIRGEEKYLRKRHDKSFDDYSGSTPRIWPDLTLWRESDNLPLRSASAMRSLRDGTVFLDAWAAVEMIKLAQSVGVLPILWTLPM